MSGAARATRLAPGAVYRFSPGSPSTSITTTTTALVISALPTFAAIEVQRIGAGGAGRGTGDCQEPPCLGQRSGKSPERSGSRGLTAAGGWAVPAVSGLDKVASCPLETGALNRREPGGCSACSPVSKLGGRHRRGERRKQSPGSSASAGRRVPSRLAQVPSNATLLGARERPLHQV
jgi:hypothetical protein